MWETGFRTTKFVAAGVVVAANAFTNTAGGGSARVSAATKAPAPGRRMVAVRGGAKAWCSR